MTARNAGFDLRDQDGGPVLALSGDWTVWTVAPVAGSFRDAAARAGSAARIDLGGLGKIDMAGAYLIDQAGGELVGGPEAAHKLVEAARAAHAVTPPEPAEPPGVVLLLERTGRAAQGFLDEAVQTLSFLGLTVVSLGRAFARPHRIRWRSVFHVMETAGLNAVPIIFMLSGFVGLVIAYLGARALKDFGATIFTVDLVGASMLREFGVIITAVLLAGRTDSSFTAEIGAMKMRQEIDALRVLGMDPVQVLVVPRVIAMLVMTPILSFIAMMAGLLGGMLVCWINLGISPVLYVSRIHALPTEYFWGGLIKTPIYGFLLAQVGCRHGLATGDSVSSLGSRVTSSVVQSIFLIIVLNAAFAIWFVEMGW